MTATMLTGTGAYNPSLGVDFFEVEWLGLEESWGTGPGSVIMLDAMNAGQILAISGTVNTEVVPNSNLAQQLPTNLKSVDSLDDLLMANYVFSNMNALGLKFAYELVVYNEIVASGDFDRLAERKTMRAMSAGLLDGVRKFWRTWLAPAVRRYAPGVGAAFGPLGGAIGTALAGAVPDYSAGETAYGAGKRMLCMGKSGPRPAWELDDAELDRLIARLMTGHSMMLHDLVNACLVEPRSGIMRFDKADVVIVRIRSSRVIQIRTVDGIEYASPKSSGDPITRLSSWALTQHRSFKRSDAIREARLSEEEWYNTSRILVALGTLVQVAADEYVSVNSGEPALPPTPEEAPRQGAGQLQWQFTQPPGAQAPAPVSAPPGSSNWQVGKGKG